MFSMILFDLTLRDVIAGIPHDAGAIVAYLLLGSFAAFIWLGSRPKKSPGEGARPPAGRGTVHVERPRPDREKALH